MYHLKLGDSGFYTTIREDWCTYSIINLITMAQLIDDVVQDQTNPEVETVFPFYCNNNIDEVRGMCTITYRITPPEYTLSKVKYCCMSKQSRKNCVILSQLYQQYTCYLDVINGETLMDNLLVFEKNQNSYICKLPYFMLVIINKSNKHLM